MRLFDREDVSIFAIGALALTLATTFSYLQPKPDPYRTGGTMEMYRAENEPYRPRRAELLQQPVPEPADLAALGIIHRGRAQAISSSGFKLAANQTFETHSLIGVVCTFPSGHTRIISEYDDLTDWAVFSTYISPAPTGEVDYTCFAGAPQSMAYREESILEEIRYTVRELKREVDELQRPQAVVAGVTAEDIARAVWDDHGAYALTVDAIAADAFVSADISAILTNTATGDLR